MSGESGAGEGAGGDPRGMRTALLLAAALAGCAAAPEPPEPPPAPPDAVEVPAVEVDASPVVDGVDNDPAWAAAREREVLLKGVAGPPSCLVRAVTCRGTLFLVVRWRDDTENRVHKPWVRDADGGWTRGKEREDAVAVAFPLEGEFTADMLSPADATWDVWHWKAGRTDPSGHAQDRMHLMTLADPGGERHAQRLPDGRTVHIRRPEDAGLGTTEPLSAPVGEERGPGFRARTPDGSAADVFARGQWSGGWWTVEFARAFRTGHADDRDFTGLDEIPFALAVLDHAEDEDHAASPPVRLLFPGPRTPDPEPVGPSPARR